MELQQRGGDVSRSDRHSGDVSALNRERGVEPSLDSKEKSSSSQWCRQTDETDSTRGRRWGGPRRGGLSHPSRACAHGPGGAGRRELREELGLERWYVGENSENPSRKSVRA